MDSTECSVDVQDGMATIELACVPDDVLKQIECNDDGIYTVSLAASTLGQDDDAVDGIGDRSAVGSAQTRGDEAADASQAHSIRSQNGMHRDVQYAVRMDKTRTTRPLNDLSGVYSSLSDLRRDFGRCLQSLEIVAADVSIDDASFLFGYIRPGHGSKGQKVNVADDEDLSNMYEVCRSRRNHILLWYSFCKDPSSRPADLSAMLSPMSNGKQRRSGSPSPVNNKRRRPSPKVHPGADTVAASILNGTPMASAAQDSVVAGHSPHDAAAVAPAAMSVGTVPAMSMSATALQAALEQNHLIQRAAMAATTSGARGDATLLGFNALASTLSHEQREHTMAAAGSSVSSQLLATPLVSAPSSTPLSPIVQQSSLTLPVAAGVNGDATVTGTAALTDPGSHSITPPAAESLLWPLHLFKERVEVRKMLIQQLQDWSALRQSDVITEDIYATHKQKILADLDRL